MWEAACLLVGLGIGTAVGWLLAGNRFRSEAAAAASAGNALREQLTQCEAELTETRRTLDDERRARVTAETRLEESARRFDEQRQLLADSEKRLKETFESLSARALQNNAEQFTSLARKSLEVVLSEAKGDLGQRQEAINALVSPLAESLKRYDEQLRAVEQNRQKAYGSLEEQVKMLATTNLQLQQETGKLAASLRDPNVRGRWGEIALKRAAELAGMVEYCDFEQQVVIGGGDADRFRPDMIVRLPAGRSVAVDAKVVNAAYIDAMAAVEEGQRTELMARHAAHVRARVRELSSKSYWDKLGVTPEFVVLFMPAESFFSAAVEVDRTLIEDAMAQRVILASPTTLIALLRAIAYGWQQAQVAENAERISKLGRELFERMRTLVEHVDRIGKGLTTAVESYNKAVASLETRVLPAARRFRELGASRGDEISEIAPLERMARRIDSSSIEDL